MSKQQPKPNWDPLDVGTLTRLYDYQVSRLRRLEIQTWFLNIVLIVGMATVLVIFHVRLARLEEPFEHRAKLAGDHDLRLKILGDNLDGYYHAFAPLKDRFEDHTRRLDRHLECFLGITPELLPLEMLVGQKGTLGNGEQSYYKVTRILGDDEALVTHYRLGGRQDSTGREVGPFDEVAGKDLVLKTSTKNWGDGQKLSLPGLWEVNGTKRLANGRTVPVLEPVPK
jgi:hypothetical protein